jgi:CheY-like chemotaxis protein
MSERLLQTILVVEDEAPLRRLVTRILEGASYRVFSACLGSEALDVLNHHPVDLLFTDLNLPDRDGMALIGEVKERWPQTRVAAYSGGVRPLALPDDLPFIAKPFSARELQEFLDSLSYDGEALAHRRGN